MQENKIATKIRMKKGCEKSRNLLEIDSIFIEGDDTNEFIKKETLHDELKENPKSIRVNISPYPYLVPATKGNEKYVRSAPDDTTDDNLLELPHE